jgi:hypothetical protein
LYIVVVVILALDGGFVEYLRRGDLVVATKPAEEELSLGALLRLGYDRGLFWNSKQLAAMF